LIISITITASARADTKDTLELAPCFNNCDLLPDWKEWVLIRFTTLKKVYADAKSYKLTLGELEKAQLLLDEKTKRINLLQDEKHQLVLDKNDMKQRIHKLENPPTWKSPVLWACVGLAAGVVGTMVAIIAIK